jgi:demethylmenaquinone methyltransferase/2-methoxy-6-polyprenyl-1,4-benzoquinol methylase
MAQNDTEQGTKLDAGVARAVPAWTEPELENPHLHAQKADKVRRMFAAIAGHYDLNNRVHSLGRDQAWRRFAVKQAGVKPGDVCLDIACGTGDLTELLAASPAAKVLGIDFTPQMLDIAREKLRARPESARSKTVYVEGDATNLVGIETASADVITIAFGIRNVTAPARAIAEFARVLRPGGRLVILEFDRPSFGPFRWFNDFYCGTVMPRTATWISRDRSGAYKYLPKSVGTFMSRGEMVDLMSRGGFRDVSARSLTLGICACYRGVRAS